MGREPRALCVKFNAISGFFKDEFIVQADHLEDGIQVMITVRSFSQDFQEEIDLGRGLNLDTMGGLRHGFTIYRSTPKKIKLDAMIGFLHLLPPCLLP